MRKSRVDIRCAGLLVLLLLVGLLSGCATMPVAKPLPAQPEPWNSVALIQEMILPPALPYVPLVQSGIYRTSFSDIEAGTEKLHQERIDEYEDILGQNLSKCFPFTVLYGKELLKVEAFKNLDSATIKTFEPKRTGQEANSMTIPTRGYNFFDFTKEGANAKKVFRGGQNSFLDAHADSLGALCKALNVDAVIVATVYIDTPGVNFIAQGQKNLILTIAFFDRDGKLCHSAMDRMTGGASSGGDLEAYTKTMDKYPALVERLVGRLANVTKSPVTSTP